MVRLPLLKFVAVLRVQFDDNENTIQLRARRDDGDVASWHATLRHVRNSIFFHETDHQCARHSRSIADCSRLNGTNHFPIKHSERHLRAHEWKMFGARGAGMIDEKIRTRARQSFNVPRRVLAVKWPINFLGAIKGPLIRNETLKESLTIIAH